MHSGNVGEPWVRRHVPRGEDPRVGGAQAARRRDVPRAGRCRTPAAARSSAPVSPGRRPRQPAPGRSRPGARARFAHAVRDGLERWPLGPGRTLTPSAHAASDQPRRVRVLADSSRSAASTSVTRAPRRAKACPSSHPMARPPGPAVGRQPGQTPHAVARQRVRVGQARDRRDERMRTGCNHRVPEPDLDRGSPCRCARAVAVARAVARAVAIAIAMPSSTFSMIATSGPANRA